MTVGPIAAGGGVFGETHFPLLSTKPFLHSHEPWIQLAPIKKSKLKRRKKDSFKNRTFLALLRNHTAFSQPSFVPAQTSVKNLTWQTLDFLLTESTHLFGARRTGTSLFLTDASSRALFSGDARFSRWRTLVTFTIDEHLIIHTRY